MHTIRYLHKYLFLIPICASMKMHYLLSTIILYMYFIIFIYLLCVLKKKESHKGLK